MKKISLTVILFIGCIQYSFAQTSDGAQLSKGSSGYDQYISVQINGLIRQVFNFNNSTASTVVNPYLLTYNINSKKTGWGLRAGIGYNYSSVSSNDGTTNTTTKLNDLQFRVGVEKAFKLSDKWTAGAGIDLLYNTNNDNTSSTVSSVDTTTTVTKTVSSSYGAGPMAWLRYNLSDKILIGTEASFYYLVTKQKNTTDLTQSDPNFPGVVTTTETTSSPTVTNGTFNLPVVFYLSVKF